MPQHELDHVLVARIRQGDADVWNELIARYEGRLLAFVESRLENRSAAEDIVQETFIGFLTSLPNYDESRALESYLFSIAAHKLTDHLRREGRRPTVPLAAPSSDGGSQWDVASPQRGPSSLLRSGERRRLEEQALVAAMEEQFDRWRRRGDWEKLKCVELLLVRGWANKDAATTLGISEQMVANTKFDFLARLRAAVQKQGLPEEVFPELVSG
jgi:RNA polymerase sigma-70 factor (ECF subfamily)